MGMDINKVRQFVSDTRFQFCSRLGKSQNVFDIIGLNENGHSNFLAWLLNPSENHGLGDSFFHELLRQVLIAYETSDGTYRKAFQMNEFFAEWNIADVEERSFNRLFIEREFVAGDSGRIDLLLVDHFQQLVVVIENKFGSSEHSEQLNRYQKFFDGVRFKDYFLIYIYLDPKAEKRLEDKDPRFEHWVGLNYEWIEGFCERIVDQNVLPEKAKLLVKDYHRYLSGQEYGSNYAERLKSTLSDLFVDYCDLVEEFDNYEIMVEKKGKVALVVPSVMKLLEYIPRIKNDEELFFTKIYLKYNKLIDHLILSNKTSHFENKVAASCPGYKLAFEPMDDSFSVYNQSWDRFANNLAVTDDKWCLDIEVLFNSTDGNRSALIKVVVRNKYFQSQYKESLLDVFRNKFNFTKNQFSEGSNTIKIHEALEVEAEIIDKLVAVVQKMSQVLLTV